MAKSNILFIMPFGIKKKQNFDNVFDQLKAAIDHSKFNVYRVDKMKGADIDSKMYKGILAADIVVADLSVSNPNVFYELGIRHSFRNKTTILIRSSKEKNIPFDINHLVVHTYNVKKHGWAERLATQFDRTDDSDSIVLKNLNKGETNIHKEFLTVFDEWANEYSTFISKVNSFKSNKEWEKGYKYISSEDFTSDFEPYLTAKALFCYKRDESNQKHLMEAFNILGPLSPETSISYEVLGLSCSIWNRIFEINPNPQNYEAAKDFNKRNISLEKTNYSIGTSVMFFVNALKHKLISKVIYDYEVNELLGYFAHVKNSENEEDKKWGNETFELIQEALGKVADREHLDESTKRNVENIRRALSD